MKKLDEELEIKVQRAFSEAIDLFNDYKTPESINKCIEGLKLLPGKPNEFDMGYTFVETICNNAYEDGLLDIVDEWLETFLDSDKKLREGGWSEFLAGRLAFDRGDKEKAKAYFIIADKNSEGRVWKKNKLDPKYFMLLKEK